MKPEFKMISREVVAAQWDGTIKSLDEINEFFNKPVTLELSILGTGWKDYIKLPLNGYIVRHPLSNGTFLTKTFNEDEFNEHYYRCPND